MVPPIEECRNQAWQQGTRLCARCLVAAAIPDRDLCTDCKEYYDRVAWKARVDEWYGIRRKLEKGTSSWAIVTKMIRYWEGKLGPSILPSIDVKPEVVEMTERPGRVSPHQWEAGRKSAWVGRWGANHGKGVGRKD